MTPSRGGSSLPRSPDRLPGGEPAGQRGTALVRGCGLAALAIVLVLLASRAAQRPGIDFAVFHRAGARFLAGADLYGPVGADFPYRYAPGVAAFFAPFALLPFAVAKAAWAACSATMAFAAALLLDRRVGSRAALAVPLAWACLVQPVAQELAHGQVDLLVLLLVLAAFLAEDRGWDVGAGALLAAAVALKVAPAVLAVDWVVRRRWRAIAGCAAGALALAIALVPSFGIAGALQQHVRWMTTQAADAPTMIGTIGNQSAWAWSRSVGLGALGGAVACLGIVAAMVSERASWRRRSLLLASVPLISAYGWPQLFVLAVPLLSGVIAARGGAAWIAGAAAATVTLASYDVAGPRVEGWTQAHRLLGLLLLVVLAAGRCGTPRAERRAPRHGDHEPAR